ncbi:uroporphyrinogen-III C-methyltransferase [Oceanimonas baumannii]|uniref:Heme biosynthesis operon protein HemX n=1 Tax=Oceanimonas baumannii TaxID=129578 RepID=A0A235CI72_9GAMM|nr:uroporphyrinogen-III C-methyltransferase [Oceanimonas baumannii]OYD24230.1 heme biosynthesis operon protein HemX [Oceanimonas baumannii]TDW58956.1 uroporphyrin-3 C-methyltransferase [Oceanimonas baumannii]
MTDNKQDQQEDKLVTNTTPASSSAEAKTEESTQAIQTEPPVSTPEKPVQEKQPSSGKGLATVAIVLAVVLAGGLYWHGHKQGENQATQIAAMETRLAEQQTALNALKSQQSATLGKLESAQQSVTEQVDGLSRKVLDLDSKRPNDWMLAEAEYLVRMAGRKLWLEHDAVSAAMMLANADERLAALNDPTLVPVRKALADDIASIKSVKKIDREGMVIKLNSINDQVDKLKLDGVIMSRAEEPDFTLSESVSDWKENLKKSWASFTDDFVTVRRRDGNVEALLSPQQHWYLSENLKGKLLQAQLAVYREQQEIYDSALAQSEQWLQDYFADDSVRQFMLEQIEQLKGQQISVNYPEQFTAQERLQQLLDNRLQRLLTGL